MSGLSCMLRQFGSLLQTVCLACLGSLVLCCRQFVSHVWVVPFFVHVHHFSCLFVWSVVYLLLISFRLSYRSIICLVCLSCLSSILFFSSLLVMSSLSCMLRRFGSLLQTVCLACPGGVFFRSSCCLLLQAVCLACLGGLSFE